MQTTTFAQAPVAPAQEPSSAPTLSEKMAACEPDRVELAKQIEVGIREVFSEALRCLETCLPDFKEPGSNDAKMHAALRNRILNAGNAKIRELVPILRNFHVVEVFHREVVFRARVTGQGIHALPAGCVLAGSTAPAP